jgi:hypothetical protein
MRLRPKAFEYRPEYVTDGKPLPSGLRYGFVAQEVEQIFPELVHEIDVDHTKPGGEVVRERVKAVNYMGFIALLVGALQEQQLAIDSLRATRGPRKTVTRAGGEVKATKSGARRAVRPKR